MGTELSRSDAVKVAPSQFEDAEAKTSPSMRAHVPTKLFSVISAPESFCLFCRASKRFHKNAQTELRASGSRCSNHPTMMAMRRLAVLVASATKQRAQFMDVAMAPTSALR